MRCSILVRVTIYIVCTVLFDIPYYLQIHVITTQYARLFTWTVYITVIFFLNNSLNIAFYHCKLYMHSPPYCSQLTNYGNHNIHKIFVKIINILILYNTYILRICIHNVTVVLILMHT